MADTSDNLVEVRNEHQFDPGALSAWLAAHLPDHAPVARLRQFHGGQSNPTFLVETPGGKLVLRKKPPGKLLPSAHRIEREYQILAALAGSDVPAPHVLALCEDDSVVGTAFYLMDFVEGALYPYPDMPGASAQQRRTAFASMIEKLAALHRVDWKACGLADLAKPENFIARQTERWGKQYRAAAPDDPDPAMAKIETWLVANMPEDAPATIVHGDYRVGNLIFSRDSHEVAALLDWELTTLGDPLADLGYFCLSYHLPYKDSGLRGLQGLDLAALGIPGESEVLEAYARASGRAGVPNWTFYLVFSLFRLASIARGVYARALAGNASSSNAMLFGEEALLLARTAQDLIARR